MTQGVIFAGMTEGHSFLGIFDRGVIKIGGHPFLQHRIISSCAGALAIK